MPERKSLYTLNIGPYAPEVTALTYPLMQHWAYRMGAEFVVIGGRHFPEWPVTYEKLQIYRLAHERQDDWSIYLDGDALVHPDTPDLTSILPRDTILHYSHDFSPVRWTYDEYFKRDGRHLGSGNWLAVASSWCRDLWHPLDDLTPAEAVARIQPTAFEQRAGHTAEHLIDDYVLSRNIARYGLKFASFLGLQGQFNFPGEFFRHDFLIPADKRVEALKQVLKEWKL